GVQPGMTVLDVSAGGGYTTELLARAVAPGGRVYAQTPRPPSPALAARLQKPVAADVTSVVRPFESAPPPDAAGKLDLVTLMFNYHDMGHLGVDRARLNAAVFAALKPGGSYVIADHSGRAGTGISESGTLHRVEEALVRREVEAAGFRLAAEAAFLRNPNDPRDSQDPPHPKDEFVLRFVKP
nr:methyltransferase domain-containing protein [Caldimonas sp.]